MRRLFRWIAGLVSVAALAKLLSARRRGHEASLDPAGTGSEPDPAEELRRKLAEVRAAAPAEAEAPTAEPQAVATPSAADAEASPGDGAPPPSIEERRAAIHARAQEAIDAMKENTP